MSMNSPNDFARYSSFGLLSLLERNGFMIEAIAAR
jgi:hypothetical protein